MIWVLADDYDLDFIDRAAVEGAEDISARGIDHPTAILTLNKRGKLLEIGLRELLLEQLFPIFCYTNIYHKCVIFCEDTLF
jgi:hypothetical protein